MQWAEKLQKRVRYLIVQNSGENHQATFKLWAEESPAAERFREVFKLEIIPMESRICEDSLQNQKLIPEHLIVDKFDFSMNGALNYIRK